MTHYFIIFLTGELIIFTGLRDFFFCFCFKRMNTSKPSNRLRYLIKTDIHSSKNEHLSSSILQSLLYLTALLEMNPIKWVKRQGKKEKVNEWNIQKTGRTPCIAHADNPEQSHNKEKPDPLAKKELISYKSHFPWLLHNPLKRIQFLTPLPMYIYIHNTRDILSEWVWIWVCRWKWDRLCVFVWVGEKKV